MLKKLVLGLIRIYQNYIRIFLPLACSFNPSCSEYARLAILKYGLFKGSLKGAKRLLSCHPFSGKAGYDPLV